MSAAAPSSAVPQVAVGDRGATRIADRVVAKIASQAAREVLRDLPTDHLVPAGRFPRASVSVRRPGTPRDGGPGRRGYAKVRLAVDLGYPADLREVCAAVRRRVVERIAELAGMAVPEVAVEIERLHSAAMTSEGERVT